MTSKIKEIISNRNILLQTNYKSVLKSCRKIVTAIIAFFELLQTCYSPLLTKPTQPYSDFYADDAEITIALLIGIFKVFLF